MKKEGKNQGRWFYTCQNQEPQRCGFFLWDEDAKLREEGAVLNNSRSEPKSRQFPAAQDGWDAGRSRGGMFAGVDPMTKGTDNEPHIISVEQNEKLTQQTWTVTMTVEMTSCYHGLLLVKKNKTSSMPLIR